MGVHSPVSKYTETEREGTVSPPRLRRIFDTADLRQWAVGSEQWAPTFAEALEGRPKDRTCRDVAKRRRKVARNLPAVGRWHSVVMAKILPRYRPRRAGR